MDRPYSTRNELGHAGPGLRPDPPHQGRRAIDDLPPVTGVQRRFGNHLVQQRSLVGALAVVPLRIDLVLRVFSEHGQLSLAGLR